MGKVWFGNGDGVTSVIGVIVGIKWLESIISFHGYLIGRGIFQGGSRSDRRIDDSVNSGLLLMKIISDFIFQLSNPILFEMSKVSFLELMEIIF